MIDVRTAVSDDVPAIQRVARASWHAAYGDFVPEATIEEMLADNDVGVAFYDRQGFERAGRHEEQLGGEPYDALVVERPL